MNELWDLFDEDRNSLNKTHVRGTVIAAGEFHVVVDVWPINSEGKILVAKRNPKKHFGGLWACTGGSVIAGENSIAGAMRELSEELGIKAHSYELILIHSIRLNDRFVDTYLLKKTLL